MIRCIRKSSTAAAASASLRSCIRGVENARLLRNQRVFLSSQHHQPGSSFLNPNDFILGGEPMANGLGGFTSTTTYTVHEYNPNAVKLGVHLSKYGVNLSKLAHEGKLEAVIGRDSEIQQTIQILSRRRKNNPCLIGESGVGKTSIAEGLANMIAQGNVPDSMKDKVIVSLDLASMIAGTKFRGEFEDRLKGVLKEIEQANDRIILFIDEMHTIVGAGGSEGAIDASNILKPSLARGNLRCLGTTTNDEYSKYIEKDPALARRFQSVYVPEPTEKDTIAILKGLRPKYESHHRIRIPDDAIETAVKLSGRYLTSKKFPDKAIDLVDEAASRLRNRIESIPPRLLEVEKELEVVYQRIEDSLISPSSSSSGNKELSVKDTLQLYKLNEEKSKLYQRWRQQNELLSNIFEINREILRLKEEVKGIRRSSSSSSSPSISNSSSSSGSSGSNNGNMALDVDKLHQTLLDIQKNEHRVQALYNEFDRLDHYHNIGSNNNSSTATTSPGETPSSSSSNNSKFRNSLDPKDLAEIISQSTGIPISSMLEDDDAKALLHMEDDIRKQIIGQDEAISAIAKCIRLSRAGLRFHDRPMGVFLMLGPTGVGKTELAKAICSFLFKDQPISSSFLRIDMSEYMERFSVSRLIGAPPGYVGYEEGGVLTDAVRRRPYQLILLDEFEKAHREVSNLLLQVFDEGRLTDSQGRVVDFRNTVIIMTSNLGSDILGKLKKDNTPSTANDDSSANEQEKNVTDRSESEEINNELTKKLESLSRSDVATKIVHQHFSPEFVNRLDEVVVFNPLTEEALMKICQIQLVKVKQLLHEKKIDFHISEAAAKAVTKRGTDLTYGARPLKRFIQNDVMSPLANLILEGTITKNDRVFMSTTGHSLGYVEELVPDLRGTKITTIATNSHGGSKGSDLEISIVRNIH